ncbi:unnamed protein product [Leptidea sinapis]|uniref:Fcf2 pre-rRNA processing C-terminal domain-containing protein n=1 Tax=Leptidea sinapis TaxID=189913 RepID=A0A5E4R8L4_9NEOP|nr:unnamed protein product [Leptidea sinapis]
MDFIIDTAGDAELHSKEELLFENEKLFVDKNEKIHKILELFDKKKRELDEQVSSEEAIQEKLKNLKIDKLYDDFFSDMQWTNSLLSVKKKPILFQFDQLDKETGKLKSNIGSVNIEKEMEKSVLKPGIEKEHALPKYNVSEKKSALDPKHFYKKNDMEVLPKYFQVGRIMDSALDHTNERLTRKQRKRTMVDELLADAELQKYNKKKYKEIIDENRKTQYKTFMKDKRKANKAALKMNRGTEQKQKKTKKQK